MTCSCIKTSVWQSSSVYMNVPLPQEDSSLGPLPARAVPRGFPLGPLPTRAVPWAVPWVRYLLGLSPGPLLISQMIAKSDGKLDYCKAKILHFNPHKWGKCLSNVSQTSLERVNCCFWEFPPKTALKCGVRSDCWMLCNVKICNVFTDNNLLCKKK